MSIGTPLLGSQRNWALPKVRVFISGPNLEVPIDVPMEESSRFAPNVSRIWKTRANLSS